MLAKNRRGGQTKEEILVNFKSKTYGFNYKKKYVGRGLSLLDLIQEEIRVADKGC